MMEATHILACPVCGSRELAECDWHLECGEVDAFECKRCDAGAPKANWQGYPKLRIAMDENPLIKGESYDPKLCI